MSGFKQLAVSFHETGEGGTVPSPRWGEGQGAKRQGEGGCLPAHARSSDGMQGRRWVPAFAGMTRWGFLAEGVATDVAPTKDKERRDWRRSHEGQSVATASLPRRTKRRDYVAPTKDKGVATASLPRR